jgi:hypothetical protein
VLSSGQQGAIAQQVLVTLIYKLHNKWVSSESLDFPGQLVNLADTAVSGFVQKLY